MKKRYVVSVRGILFSGFLVNSWTQMGPPQKVKEPDMASALKKATKFRIKMVAVFFAWFYNQTVRDIIVFDVEEVLIAPNGDVLSLGRLRKTHTK